MSILYLKKKDAAKYSFNSINTCFFGLSVIHETDLEGIEPCKIRCKSVYFYLEG